MLLNDHQIRLLQAHITSIWLGSCVPEQSTDIMRLTGARLAEDKLHLDLFVPVQFTETFFNNLQENQKISFLCSSTRTFEAYQVKGIYLGHRACTQEEIRYQQAYMEGFTQNLVAIGVKAGLAFANYYQEPTIAIRMRSEEIYEQTPKAGTGKKVS